MPPLNAWLEIRAKAWFVLALAFLLALLLAGAAILCWRLWKRAKRLSRQVREQGLQSSVGDERQTPQVAAREEYRRLLHEVANALQPILLDMENMATYLPDDLGRWRQKHAIVSGELRQLAGLIANLRLLSRMESSDVPLKRGLVDIREIADAVIFGLGDQANARGVEVAYSGPRQPAQVLGDGDQLRQALMNLVDNGIKYAKDEGGSVLISVVEQEDRLLVRVSDDGIGIPEEDLPHIFDPVYRAPDARSFRRPGSGLGLTIVKRIVEQHGGEVKVQSQVGEGTTFTFDLPLYTPS